MTTPVRLLTRLLSRWSRQQETAVRQMAGQKPAGRRIRAYSKSERVEARFLLLAMVPFFALMASDELGWSRGLLWHGTLWLGVAWAALVIGFGSLGSIRAIRRSKSPKK